MPQVGSANTYQPLGLQLHGHAVVGGVADGRFVGDAIGGNKDKRVVGLKDLGDGLTLTDWEVDQQTEHPSGGRVHKTRFLVKWSAGLHMRDDATASC